MIVVIVTQNIILELYMFDFIQPFDTQVMLFFQNVLRTSFLNPIMVFLSYIGYVSTIWIIISIVLIIRKETRKAGIFTLATMLICYAFNDLIIKGLIDRARPYETIPALTLLTFVPGSSSFPSGHACSSFAASLILTKFLGKKGALFYILAVLIAISRIYVGAHYLSDVVVGSIVGTTGAFIVFLLARNIGLITPDDLLPHSTKNHGR